MNRRIILHADIDNTLIYSYKNLQGMLKQIPEAAYVSHQGTAGSGEALRCVEQYEGRPLSFITQETCRLLKEVKKWKCIIVVPTTTRTVEQYERIDFGVGSFHYALVCNGGILLSDGKEDEGWYRNSLELVKYSREEIGKALEILEQDKRRCFELRFIRDLFVFTKCEEPEQVVQDLQSVLDVTLVDVFHNGIKVYVVPKALNKGNAVKRFRNYSNAEYVIAAGDSVFDVPMLEAADYGIATPALAGQYNFSEKVNCPAEDKLYAEAMLEMVLRLLDK